MQQLTLMNRSSYAAGGLLSTTDHAMPLHQHHRLAARTRQRVCAEPMRALRGSSPGTLMAPPVKLLVLASSLYTSASCL